MISDYFRKSQFLEGIRSAGGGTEIPRDSRNGIPASHCFSRSRFPLAMISFSRGNPALLRENFKLNKKFKFGLAYKTKIRDLANHLNGKSKKTQIKDLPN